MSFPPPPGFDAASKPHASLPARPPPSTVSPAPAFKSSSNGSTKTPFTAFAPRAIANASTYRTSSPAQYSAPAAPTYSAPPQYSSAPQAYTSQLQQSGAEVSQYGAAPQIRNPFVPTPGNTGSSDPFGANYDPEYEAQYQQWQSAYIGKDSDRPGGSIARSVPVSGVGSKVDSKDDAPKTVVRSGGGENWTDSSLLEWDPAHFRIFVGNLAGEVTDESLLKAFVKYSSVQKARVVRDKRTTKSKGYGFVSFSNGDDYFQAAREMQGKYIGSHPVSIKRATTEVRPTAQKEGKHRKGKGGGKVEHGGINKKQTKTKGGMKILG